MATMSETQRSKLAILLWATDPAQPHLCATPFFHAAAAAAMDVEVEVHFAARSVLLLVPGCAQSLRASELEAMTVYEHMQQAVEHGARFLSCGAAIAAQGLECTELLPELYGRGGATAFVARSLDPEWATLVF